MSGMVNTAANDIKYLENLWKNQLLKTPELCGGVELGRHLDLRPKQAPVLVLYGGDDARVNATIEPAAREMKKGKVYEL